MTYNHLVEIYNNGNVNQYWRSDNYLYIALKYYHCMRSCNCVVDFFRYKKIVDYYLALC